MLQGLAVPDGENWWKVYEECKRKMEDIHPLAAWKTPASSKQGFVCAEACAAACKNRASCCQNSSNISAKHDQGAADVSETHLQQRREI